ncbi:MAG TPA: methyltransferase domain-containing protein [Solirubrobacterales bacterium]|jgi:tRNA (mo5U34)-methyltransferase|nr:methyltransferase domain-containing protein [Solirubrobacterales bacterium]
MESTDLATRVEAPERAKTPEQVVADILPIEADPPRARQVLDEVPFWFHTFALNRAEAIYTPGAALDHRYRIPALPGDYSGLSVLDVGTFDGFYAFVAEDRGADRILAIDNEQYVHWVQSRWDIELDGGEGFRAIHRLLDSNVEYRMLDAFDLDDLDEPFDLIYCFGILHRVQNPWGLLRRLRDRLDPDGRVLLETHGVPDDDGSDLGVVRVPEVGEVYKDDAYVFWEFTTGSLDRLSRYAGFREMQLHDTPVIDGHPRILATLTADDA